MIIKITSVFFLLDIYGKRQFQAAVYRLPYTAFRYDCLALGIRLLFLVSINEIDVAHGLTGITGRDPLRQRISQRDVL